MVELACIKKVIDSQGHFSEWCPSVIGFPWEKTCPNDDGRRYPSLTKDGYLKGQREQWGLAIGARNPDSPSSTSRCAEFGGFFLTPECGIIFGVSVDASEYLGLGVVVHPCNLSMGVGGGGRIRSTRQPQLDSEFEASRLGLNETLFQTRQNCMFGKGFRGSFANLKHFQMPESS